MYYMRQCPVCRAEIWTKLVQHNQLYSLKRLMEDRVVKRTSTCDVGEVPGHAFVAEIGASEVQGAHAVVNLHLDVSKLDGISQHSLHLRE